MSHPYSKIASAPHIVARRLRRRTSRGRARAIAAKIRAKNGYAAPIADDAEFLRELYTAQRAHLEQQLRGSATMAAVFDATALWPLFRAVARGDRDAWPALMAALEPELLVMAKRAPIGRLRTRDDSPHDIVAGVFARLHARDHAAIRTLCEGEQPAELQAWLRVIVRRVAIDYMRGAPEFERGNAARAPGWVSLASLSSSAPGPVADSRAAKRELITTTVRDMVARTAAEVKARGDDAYAHLALEWKIPQLHVRRLAARGEQFLVVLAGVFEGNTQAEIANRVAMSRREVELTVRYLEQLLQARFSES